MEKKQLQKLADKLSESGLNAHFSDNIHYSIYRKACVNGTMNGLCTILDVNMAELGKHRLLIKWWRRLSMSLPK